MAIFNALLNLRELKEFYSGKPVCVCPLYKGVINNPKIFEATGNSIVLPEYKSLKKLAIDFSPKQAGTGDPSPDNVRPISGWDSVKVTVSNEDESHDYDVTLPKTIYGGTVDAVKGRGEKTWEFYKFTGEEKWQVGYDNLKNVFRYYFSPPLNPEWGAGQEGYCNIYKTLSNPTANETGILFGSNNDEIYLFLPKQDYPDVKSVKSYLASQYVAGTPVTVCYKPATPESFKVSQVSIPSLRSVNYFFTNGENMDIIYKKESFWSDEA